MGKVLSLMTKPFREFNIESKAHAVISKEKPIAAPKHKSDKIDYDRYLRDKDSDVFKESLKKHENLDKYLKNIYLTSQDPQLKDKTEATINPERPLPLNRTSVEDFQYGFYEPKRIPLGKVTVGKVLRFISEHHVKPKENTATKISEDYLLPEKTVGNILKYFRMYEVYIPQERKIKGTFAGPVVSRKKIPVQDQKLLESFTKKEKGMFKD